MWRGGWCTTWHTDDVVYVSGPCKWCPAPLKSVVIDASSVNQFACLPVEQTVEFETDVALPVRRATRKALDFPESDDDYLQRIWLEAVSRPAVCVPDKPPRIYKDIKGFAPLKSLPLFCAPCPALAIPTIQTFVPTKVGGSGNCWRAVFPDLIHDTVMTLQEFIQLSNSYLDYIWDRDQEICPYYIRMTSQDDGDLHLEEAIFWSERLQLFIGQSSSGPEERCLDDRFIRLDRWLVDCDTPLERLVGAPAANSVSRQLPDVFDIALDPTMFATSRSLAEKLASWYWRHAVHHPGIHVPEVHPLPPSLDPGPLLPPSLVGSRPTEVPTPIGHICTPLEMLARQLQALAVKGLEHIKEAYDAIILKLNDLGIFPDAALQFLILNFRHFCQLFGEQTQEWARYAFNHFGLGFLIGSVQDLSIFLAQFVRDICNMSYNVLDYGFLGLKIIYFLTQDFTEWHGPDHVYRRALLAGELNIQSAEVALLERHALVARQTFRTLLPERYMVLGQQAGMLTASNPAETNVVTAAATKIAEIITNLNALPTLVLPEDTDVDDLKHFQSAFPEYLVDRGVNSQPHAKLAAIRRAFRGRANDHLGRRNRPVRAVGASNTEMPTINRLVHNCWPNDSGRTDKRKKSHWSPANAAHRALTSEHRFQDCDHVDMDGECINGSDIWSFFSAHDIHPREFIKEMARSASDTAVIALHLPFPLLDRRVRSYVDHVTGLRYEVEGDKLLVYHLSADSAGYSHDFETVYAWMSNLPNFSNAHVQIEVLSQIGTAVLLELTIGSGRQETVPSVWSCQREEFYILPELLASDLRSGERQHFVVPARKFEQITAYIATLNETDVTPQNVVSKIRGMLAEIRVGVHTVEPRWAVSFPQLFSLVHHALFAFKLHRDSTEASASRLKGYYSRVAWRSGGFAKRWVQYRLDLLLFRAGGETQPLDDSCWRWLFSNRFDHKHTYNPYQRAGVYRLCNLEVRGSDKLNKAVEVENLVKAPLVFGKAALWITAVSARAAASASRATLRGLSVAVRRLRGPVRPEDVPLPDDSDWGEASDDESVTGDPAVGGDAAGSGPDETHEDDGEDGPTVEAANVPLPQSFVATPVDSLHEDPPIIRAGDRFNPDDLGFRLQSLASTTSTPSAGPAPGSPGMSFRSETPDRSALPSPVIAATVPAQQFPDDNEFDHFVNQRCKSGEFLSVPEHALAQPDPRVMDFVAPISPVSQQHQADRVFSAMLKGKTRFVWPKIPVVVPCPSNGGARLLESAYNSDDSFPVVAIGKLAKQAPVRDIVDHLCIGSKPVDAIVNKMTRFANHLTSKPGSAKAKFLAIDGPPRSAKSTMVRLFISTFLLRALVYVPSKELKKQWEKDSTFHQHAEVLTRHSVPKGRNYQVGIVDEVYNFNTRELEFHVRAMLIAGCKLIILVGDKSQRESTGLNVDSVYLRNRIELHTCLGLPQDAFALYKRLNNLSDMYSSTGPRANSVFFTESPPPAGAELEFGLHKHASRGDVATIGTVQGSRASSVVFWADNSLKAAAWVHDNPSRLSVAYTRHSEISVVVAAGNVIRDYALGLPLERYYTVGARRPDLEHTLAVNVQDDLIQPLFPHKVTSRIAKLRAVLSTPLVMEGHAVVLANEEASEEVTGVALERRVMRSELMDFVDSQTNFELPDPTDRDLITAHPKRSFKFREPGPPVQRSDVRNDLPRSHLLAAIQVNSSGFDSFKNLVDRQIATTKSSRFGTADMQEGQRIYQRFRKCFYSREAVDILHSETEVSWLAETEVNALNMIASEPLGEPSSLLVDAEFKTQTKAKAQPAFAATLPYGQSILANSKAFGAYFANDQPGLYQNAQRLLRPNAIVDYGMSDDALSARLQVLGVAADLNGPNNVQADVSKQDSSHTAAYLYAFLLVCRDCGLSEEKIQFYLAYVQRYRFISRGVDATASTVSFNLGSGDPFTLIRNDIMEMCTIACRYRDADTMTIVEKGDDVHGVIRSLAPHVLANLPSIRATKLTVDFGIVGYHAGRFHNGKRYLVDPVRAFLKHFTRLSDSNVTNDILYGSYVSRATDYSPEEVDFLMAACQQHYPYYSADHVAVMIRTMISLRDRVEFEKWSVMRIRPFVVTVDSATECAVNCVRAVRPGRTKAYYAQFRNLPRGYLVALMQQEGIRAKAVDLGGSVPRGVIAVSHNHARVEVDLGTFNTPANPHASRTSECLPLLSPALPTVSCRSLSLVSSLLKTSLPRSLPFLRVSWAT